jgi:hypothetical protein
MFIFAPPTSLRFDHYDSYEDDSNYRRNLAVQAEQRRRQRQAQAQAEAEFEAQLLRQQRERAKAEDHYRQKMMRDHSPFYRHHHPYMFSTLVESDNDDDETEVSYQIVRSPDGRLYRMPINPARVNHRPRSPKHAGKKLRKKLSDTDRSSDDHSYLVRDQFGNLVRLQHPRHLIGTKGRVPARSKRYSDSDSCSTSSSERTPVMSNQASDRIVSQVLPIKISRSKATNDHQEKLTEQKVNVFVEDASDSEFEDVNVWRSRRPSPGKWIEPVEQLM